MDWNEFTKGDSAFSELRTRGKEQVWLCQVGCQDQDGAYPDFKEKMLKSQLEMSGNAITIKFAGDLQLVCGYQIPLVVAGQIQSTDNEKHYDTPYSVTGWNAPQMDISYGLDTLRLNFD